MTTFIERLEIEKSELDDKISKLNNFLNSDNFKTVSISQHNMYLNKHTSNVDGPHEIYYGSKDPVQVCVGIILG